jgi:hypothetical protein
VIGALETRQTLLYRSDNFKQKLIAANVTQVIVVVATEPSFSDELLTRCVVAAENQAIEVLIVLNKCDLDERLAAASAALLPYEDLGYRVVRLSARENGELLLPYLANHTSLLIGQSGMGKSTLINALIPGARCADPRDLAGAPDRQAHHDARPPLSSRRRVGADRLARADGIRAAPPVAGRHCARLSRTAAAARPVPLPQLPARARTRLQRACRSSGTATSPPAAMRLSVPSAPKSANPTGAFA